MLIKRYPNRKLYNTQTKQYITLDGVADLLRDGMDVHVVDHVTGDDVTAQTLSQVIVGQEKKQSGFIPRPVLAGLVQAGGATLESLRRAMLLPLDILNLVDDEIQRRIENLVQQGEVTETEGHHWIDQLLAVTQQPLSNLVIEREIKKIIDQQGVPTHQEIQRLINQINSLTEKLDQIKRNSVGGNSLDEEPR